jgi:obg-like ATPase 1
VDPLTDIAVINFELALADMAQIERRIERLGKGRAKSNADKEAEQEERDVLAKLTEFLDLGKPARLCDLTTDQWVLVQDLMLLTAKPCIYAANVNEGDLADNGDTNDYVAAVRKHAGEEGSLVTIISAQVESELIKLDPEERAEFLADLGADEGGLQSLIRNAYTQLKLQTYFTSGEKETRAWTIKQGFTAPQAAGVIHTDFEKGFIKVGGRVPGVRWWGLRV